MQQVARLGAVEHRILVGQVHRSHIAAAQLASHRCRLLAGANQHGDVGRAQAAEASLRAVEPRACIVEQHGDVLGAALGKLPKAGLNIVQTGVQRQRQGRTHSRRGDKRFAPPLGVDRLERQRVAGTLPGVGPEHEGALAVSHFGLLKQVVHGRHQRHRRAVVGAQHVVAPLGGPPGRQVTVDVCPPKAVDGLLGVANQQQGAGRLVGLDAVQAVENSRLHRRGVLEFVDQRHRVLGQHAGTQALGVDTVEVGVECVVEPGQHVRKAKGSGLTLEVTHPLGDAGSSVQAQAGGQGRQVVQRLHQLLEGRKVPRQIDRLAGLQGLDHAVGPEPGGAGFHIRPGDLRIVGPVGQGLEPRCVVLRTQLLFVERTVRGGHLLVEPGFHVQRSLRPADLQRGKLGRLHGPQLVDQVRQAALPCAVRQHLAQQSAGVFRQRGHVGPDAECGVQQLAGQRVKLLAPVVLRGFILHRALVGGEFFVEQATAVERVFAQHALAPRVDGVNGRVVHALGGHRQAPRGAGARRAFGVRRHQVEQKAVGRGRRGFAPEAPGGLQQARADAVGQLPRGRAGERHHQDFGRHQRAGKAVFNAVPAFASVAQHEPQVERRDGPGLAGARAGLDQATAPQREGQRVERLGRWRGQQLTHGRRLPDAGRG